MEKSTCVYKMVFQCSESRQITTAASWFHGGRLGWDGKACFPVCTNQCLELQTTLKFWVLNEENSRNGEDGR